MQKILNGKGIGRGENSKKNVLKYVVIIHILYSNSIIGILCILTKQMS